MCKLECVRVEVCVSWGVCESWGVYELGLLIIGVCAVRVGVCELQCENWGVRVEV